ncbi:class I mannose-6-phosphate isomerase [Alloacidobacterium dinghuense]|uniref:Class I mannose-6-phosphate isomerase n=2 Tax=Alloacidobacterium dinghuense TaxID=2763107 RepID=A0A7G8BC58_9BACT|nr:class I mannose-6-phosphate isomerase [Alloacidobacterium dinghuense]
MRRKSNYDKFPIISVSTSGSDCWESWPLILDRLRAYTTETNSVICIECYPGVQELALRRTLEEGLQSAAVIMTTDLLKRSSAIERMVGDVLGDDPVFGRMNKIQIRDFFDEWKLGNARDLAKNWNQGLLIIVGTGATLVVPEPNLLIYADMARWEIQQRQRRNAIGNFGADNLGESAGLKYKRAFFVDWRAADRLKASLFSRIDFWLDTNDDIPKLVTGQSMREGLRQLVQRPFRVVPYFDPGPWGGHWMEEVCDLPNNVPNHAWCFDCVPEENSLLLKFGSTCVEIPAMNLTLLHPRELLGQSVYSQFGAEFPIRFDFLDTMGGGNLSLQVHPKRKYIWEKFRMKYTQDESYYLLDAAEDGSVYLGVKNQVNRDAMITELQAAQSNGRSFRAEVYVNKFPAKKHDHFLIPAGTVHCSGKNSMILEISATPYIFTFKLWDWDRLGLDGLPRPIHIDHGLRNIAWDRDTNWVRKNLINQIELVAEGPGWREERTGLHQLEFIETRRHWFTGTTPHETRDTVNVLNLVEGEEAIVESPTNAFEPFVVHYAETFIVPAEIGAYRISPTSQSIGKSCATIKASVRNGWSHSEQLAERSSAG